MILLAIVSILLLYLIIKKKNQVIWKGFPEPPAHFIFGHMLDVTSTTNVLNVVTNYTTKYGTTVKLIAGPPCVPYRQAVLSSDYKFIEFILSSNQILTKSENYQYLMPWLGRGLLISDGVHWKQHRKILTPAFHFEILKQFIETFERVGNVLIEKLEKYDGSDSVDVHPLVTLCTLDIICETAMGTKIQAQNGKNLEYVQSVQEMCRIIIERPSAPMKITNLTFWMTRDYHVQKKALKILHDFTLKVINSKKIQKIEQKIGKMAFLDLLLKFSQEGALLSNDDIREEVDTFMFEGHDTTSSTICFTLYCLADHPEIQEKILEEQKDLFGDEKNPLVTYTELQNMKYLERVIKEVLRLYPAVPILGRYTTEDIEFDGRVVPKDSNIVLFIYGLHRNPKYFPEPEKFDPDRFEKFDNSFPYSYIPFSAGPRNCIGQKFAMLEMKSAISKIIRHFELRPATPRHDLILSVEAVLKSKNGVRIGLKKRP